jgi:hypothetical protein
MRLWRREFGERLGEKLGENELAIVIEISNDPKITIAELSQLVGISTTELKTT